MAAVGRNCPHSERELSGSGATPNPLQCSCVLGHRVIAPAVATVAVVIALTLIAAIPVTVAFSSWRCQLVTFYSGVRASDR